MNELTQRLNLAIDFLEKNGYAKNDSAIARAIGVTAPFLSMCKSGSRKIPWEMLLDLCDHYPINFWWLRSGEGDMIGGSIREHSLLRKIAVLEDRIRQLEKG